MRFVYSDLEVPVHNMMRGKDILIPEQGAVIFSARNNLHTFFFPVLHKLDHEVGTALGLGQDGYHRARTGASET